MHKWWLEPLNNYCERLDSGFWAEPVNALSNGSILLAGMLGMYWAQQIKGCKYYLWAVGLSGLILLVAVGSFLFHTFANVWSLWADVIPIMVFMMTYLAFVLRHVFNFRWALTAVLLVVFMAVGYGSELIMPQDILSGSLIYSHAVFTLLLVGAILHKKQHPMRLHIWALGGVFLMSLSFRSLDAYVCPNFPLGTHFLWHIFNGLVMAIAVHSIVYWSRLSRL